jgi:hypothetical protein
MRLHARISTRNLSPTTEGTNRHHHETQPLLLFIGHGPLSTESGLECRTNTAAQHRKGFTTQTLATPKQSRGNGKIREKRLRNRAIHRERSRSVAAVSNRATFWHAIRRSLPSKALLRHRHSQAFFLPRDPSHSWQLTVHRSGSLSNGRLSRPPEYRQSNGRRLHSTVISTVGRKRFPSVVGFVRRSLAFSASTDRRIRQHGGCEAGHSDTCRSCRD